VIKRGRSAKDGATLEVIDPATEEPIGSIPRATPADIEDVLRAAARGFETWKRVPPFDRSEVLQKLAGTFLL
jgi:succinate-semialdehyde dehydrogenase/glutarate-semialdehyde dehydrogenase